MRGSVVGRSRSALLGRAGRERIGERVRRLAVRHFGTYFTRTREPSFMPFLNRSV